MPTLRICAECGSSFLPSASEMRELCPECSHILYGYENCDHEFSEGKCIKCLWDGSRSSYTSAHEKQDARSKKQEKNCLQSGKG